MTEQELTTLAKQTLDWLGKGRPHYAIQLASGYLARLAERDALKAQLEEREVELWHKIDALRDQLAAVEAARDQHLAERDEAIDKLIWVTVQRDEAVRERDWLQSLREKITYEKPSH